MCNGITTAENNTGDLDGCVNVRSTSINPNKFVEKFSPSVRNFNHRI